MVLGSTLPLAAVSIRNVFWSGKGGRWVGLRTLQPSCADCFENWEPQPHGTLRAWRGLYKDCLTITFITFIYRGADKSLARPGRKQATSMSKSSWMMDPTRSREMPSCSAFDIAEIRRSSKINSWIFNNLRGGRAKDLSAPRLHKTFRSYFNPRKFNNFCSFWGWISILSDHNHSFYWLSSYRSYVDANQSRRHRNKMS
jgi:hypothetical protein